VRVKPGTSTKGQRKPKRQASGGSARRHRRPAPEVARPNRNGPNRNGAGIAADPTLTDAWPCLRRDENLASDVFPSIRRSGSQVLSPALAPASGSTLQLLPVGCARSEDLRFLPRTGLQRAAPRSGFPWPRLERLRVVRSEDLSKRLLGAAGSARPILELRRVSVTDLVLRRAEALCMGGLKTRADRFRDVFTV